MEHLAAVRPAGQLVEVVRRTCSAAARAVNAANSASVTRTFTCRCRPPSTLRRRPPPGPTVPASPAARAAGRPQRSAARLRAGRPWRRRRPGHRSPPDRECRPRAGRRIVRKSAEASVDSRVRPTLRRNQPVDSPPLETVYTDSRNRRPHLSANRAVVDSEHCAFVARPFTVRSSSSNRCLDDSRRLGVMTALMGANSGPFCCCPHQLAFDLELIP